MEQNKHRFLKNMVGFSMMSWITFAIGFVASPLATRLFTTVEKGKIDMFFTYAGLYSSVCYLGLDQAFVRFFGEPPGKAGRKGLFTFCMVAPILFGAVGSLALSPLWQSVSGRVNEEPDLIVYLCLCAYCFTLVVYRFLSLGYRMEQNAKMYTIQGVIHVLITKIAYLSVGFISPTGKAAILCLPVLSLAFTAVFLHLQRDKLSLSSLGSIDRPFLRSVGRFALPLAPMALLGTFNSSVSVLVLKRLLDLSAVGIFTSALGLATTVNIIQTGFNTYWAPYVFENYQGDGAKRFFTVHRLMACLLTFFGLAITLMQTPVFLLLGESYRSSVVFFPFLLISPICYCLGETTSMGVDIAKKTYWTTIIYVFSLAVNLALCFVLVPRMGMAGAALASAFTGILTLALRTVVSQRYYRMLESCRYLLFTVGLMLAASFGNLYLTGAAKYLLLAGLTGVAFAAFYGEIKTLWRTAGQVLGAIRRKVAGRKEHTDE